MKSFKIIALAAIFAFAISCKDKKVESPEVPVAPTETSTNTGDIPVAPAATEVESAVQASTTSSSTPPTVKEKNGNINWYEIQSALNYSNPEGKMFFIDVYTDWCGWCKVMDKKTFSDSKVQKVMNERFHMIKFDAEQKQPITFNNKTFEWVELGRNGLNMLAMEFLGQQMGFPSYVILDKDKKPIKTMSGFMETAPFLEQLASVK